MIGIKSMFSLFYSNFQIYWKTLRLQRMISLLH